MVDGVRAGRTAERANAVVPLEDTAARPLLRPVLKWDLYHRAELHDTRNREFHAHGRQAHTWAGFDDHSTLMDDMPHGAAQRHNTEGTEIGVQNDDGIHRKTTL